MSRAPSAQIEARAVLPNHALAFGGFSQRWGGAVASVVPEPGARVEGLLYRITAPAALDRLEGTPDLYRRVRIVLVGGTSAETYVLTPEQVAGHPVIASGSWRARRNESVRSRS